MGSSSSKNCCLSEKSRRVRPTISFILKATSNNSGQFIEVVSKENLQLGDIILFPISTYPQSSSCKHVGVYYGNKKVIHFDGEVSIQGIDAMERIKGKYQIRRPKQRINEEAFMKKADDMLNAKTEYNGFTNNCVHFALFLLDMEEFYHEIVSDAEVGNGNDAGEEVPLNMTGQVDQNECNRARQFQNNMSQREISLRHFP